MSYSHDAFGHMIMSKLGTNSGKDFIYDGDTIIGESQGEG